MSISQALLNKIATARATVGGNNIKDGEYVFVVKKAFVEQKFKGTMFIAEFDVVESSAVTKDIEPNPVGSDCSIALNLDANVSAPGNMKQFYLGLLGLDEATTPQETISAKIKEYVGDDNKARGMLVGCSTYRKVTKTGPNAGKEGVYPRFNQVTTAEGNGTDEIKARRADLDSNGR